MFSKPISKPISVRKQDYKHRRITAEQGALTGLPFKMTHGEPRFFETDFDSGFESAFEIRNETDFLCYEKILFAKSAIGLIKVCGRNLKQWSLFTI